VDSILPCTKKGVPNDNQTCLSSLSFFDAALGEYLGGPYTTINNANQHACQEAQFERSATLHVSRFERFLPLSAPFFCDQINKKCCAEKSFLLA
jgi:hypothetical protein